MGPWLILERLDFGSFGVVYRAQRADHSNSPPVALKVARRPRDPRFEREAELLRLGFPGAPRFEDEGLWTAPSGESYPYVVMELEVAALGACWFVAAAKPPCGTGAYELDGRCVRAVYPAPPQPTSEEP